MFQTSVIIPVYNAERFIRQAVESAVHLDEVGEIILIEDQSPDNAMQVCRKLEETYQKVIVYQHPDKGNHGAAASRNLGIQKAKFPFIAFLDADDVFLPNRFKKTMQVFKDHEDADGVYESVGAFEGLIPNQDSIDSSFITKIDGGISPESLFFQISPVGRKGHFHLNGFVVKKELIEQTGLFEPTLRLSQDTHFSIKSALKGNLYPGYTDTLVALRRVHPDNRCTDHKKMLTYRPQVFWSLSNWSSHNGIQSEKKAILNALYFVHLIKLLIYYPKEGFSIAKKTKDIIIQASINVIGNLYSTLTFFKHR